jgi:hypothetical protein
MLKDAPITALQAVSKISDVLRSARSDSLPEYVKDTRVEPIVLLEAGLRHNESITEVLQSLCSIFTGYYLQAISVSVNVGNVDVSRLLGKLSTKRDPLGAAASSDYLGMISTEDYGMSLPDYSVSLEDREEQRNRTSGGPGRGATEIVTTQTDLSVGKLFDVEIESEGQKAKIPVSVRLNVKQIAENEMLHILSVGVKDNSVKERYYRWRAGELSFVKDLLLCQDIIDEHKNTLMKDGTNIYKTLLERKRSNTLASVLSGNPSVNNASGLVVISADTAKKLEREMGGKLSSFRKREKLFKEAFIMIMCVVDPEWDHVTFYHRSIDSETELTMRELKQANKGTGPDVADILKAYQMSAAPNL